MNRPEPSTHQPPLPDPGSVCLFLDFDGTLVELADRPDSIAVVDGLGDLLAALHKATSGRTCIVSGRQVDDILRYLPDFPGDIFGAHGAEARKNGQRSRHASAGTLAELHDRVTGIAQAAAAYLVETKDTGVVLHYRADPSLEDAALAEMGHIADATPGFTLHRSKLALELRPEDVSKGVVVADVMAEHTSIRPVVIGDDVTDEEAMEVAEAMNGLTIKVGAGVTRAGYRLSDTAAVHDWLRGLLAGGR